MNLDAEIRQARLDDREAVVSFTEDTWTDHGANDYIPRVFEEWVETDGPRQHTFVADVAGEDDPERAIAGIVQAVRLSEHEAWGQGIRVNPEYRGRGVSEALTHACFEWARDRGATVMRIMVFSWNAPGLGQARALGYRPVTEFRWVHPDPDPDGLSARPELGGDLDTTRDPDAAWTYWTDSAPRDHLGGLGLTTEESWALTEVTRQDLHRLADGDRLLAVQGSAGTRGVTYRTRTYDRENDEGVEETWAEYGVGAWADLPAARELLSAVARDAHDCGAQRTRVLVPETPRVVTDAAYLGIEPADDPDFVLAADLTADHG